MKQNIETTLGDLESYAKHFNQNKPIFSYIKGKIDVDITLKMMQDLKAKNEKQ